MKCDYCKRDTEIIGKGFEWEKEIPLELYELKARPTMFLCRDCCIDLKMAPEGYAFSKNILSGKEIMIREENKGVPHMDPAYERYHCM